MIQSRFIIGKKWKSSFDGSHAGSFDSWLQTTRVEGDCFSLYPWNKRETLYIQDLYYLVAMSTENEKDDETQTVKPKIRSETDKEQEKEELETLDMESTGGGKEGGGG